MTNEKLPRRGLGRGLSSLIPGAGLPGGGADATGEPIDGMRTIPLTRISLNPYQPRETFGVEELSELTESIREHGVLQPIVVRPKRLNSWELVAGERRFRAATAAGLAEIPAVVRSLSDREALALAIIENIQRENLNPIESARGYRRLQDEFGLSQTEVAREVGKPQPTVANSLRLLMLPDPVVASIATREITEGHGKAILGVEDDDGRIRLWREVVDKKLNVRETERRAGVMKQAPEQVIPRGMPSPDEALHIDALEEDLSLVLGARTRVRMTKPSRGVIEISFYEREELDAIVDRLLRR